MIGTIKLRVNMGQPNVPLRTIAVFAESSATIGLVDMPQTSAGATITSVAVSVQNADGATAAVPATLTNGVWSATFGGNHFKHPGHVENGLTVTVSGVSAAGVPATWIVGKGDVEIMPAALIPGPGEDMQTIHLRYEVPQNPLEGDVIQDGQSFKIYTNGKWEAVGGGAEKPLNKTDVLYVQTMGALIESLRRAWPKLGGTVALLAAVALAACGAEPGTAALQDVPLAAPVVTNAWQGVSGRVFDCVTNAVAAANTPAALVERDLAEGWMAADALVYSRAPVEVTIPDGGTLSPSGSWPDGKPVFVHVVPRGAYAVSTNVKHLGYGAWPSRSFHAVAYSMSGVIVVNVIAED